MSSAKPITHSRWLKGLQAGFDRYAQPKGSFARASNMLLTRRGALKACDGTALITQFNSAFQATFGPITEIFLFQPTGANAGYFGIVKDSFTHIGVPTGLFLANVSSGVLTGTYTYVMTALDGVGGETTVSIQIQITPTARKIQITWTPVPNAVGGYNLYRTVANGALGSERFLVTIPGQSTASYTDNLPDSALGAGTFPVTDTTQVCHFYSFTFPSYTTAQRILTLPADSILRTGGGTGGGYGGSGSGGGGSSGYNPPTPSGGVFGNLSPLPMIVQFVNKMMLALGNGITPYQSDGTTLGTIPIVNSFVAAYPTWAASTVFNQGDQIQVTVSSVAYVFTATQGGETGSGSPPAFSATLGSTISDGNIIWKNSGQVSGSPPPRGAAHEEVYAGSLWVANTGVALSSDQLDGPSALRMSDLNAPTSWNPLNAAQIQPDDGDQCTGIKAFTIAEAGIAPQNFLTYFKNFSAFVIQGVFGSSDFAITRLQTDMGCVAPRTLQFVPGYGIMRLTHLGFAVTDGISDKLQEPEAIRPYLFPESTESDITPIDQSYLYFAKAAQTSNPPMYVCAMPLQGLASAIFGGVAVVGLGGPALLMSVGEYYIKIQAVTTTGQTYTSGEYAVSQAIIRVGGHIYGYPTGIAVTLPNVSVVAEWNIYMGTAPGQEDEFITVPSGVLSVTINNATTFTAGEPVTTQGGSLSRLFCYDLILKSWTVVDLPFPISVLKQFRTPGSSPITVLGGFFDGALRRWQAGDSSWDAGAIAAGAASTDVQWSFRDAEVFVEGGTVKLFHNEVILRGDGGPASISVSPTINGTMQATIKAALTALGQGQYEARARILQTAANLNLTVSGSGPATIEAIDYQAIEKPAGAALVYS